jgi:large subunit ribosomal protein L18
MSDKTQRLKRAVKTRANIAKKGKIRLSVHRTPKHFDAQLISPDGTVLAYVSTKGEAYKKLGAATGGNVEAAVKLADLLVKAAAKHKITDVAFDRSGFRFHGRIKAFADAVRAGGLIF